MMLLLLQYQHVHVYASCRTCLVLPAPGLPLVLLLLLLLPHMLLQPHGSWYYQQACQAASQRIADVLRVLDASH